MNNLDETIVTETNTLDPKEIITSGESRVQHKHIGNDIDWSEYIYIIEEASFYSTRFKKYFTNRQIAQNLQALTGKKITADEVDRKLQEGAIKKYYGFCYGKDEEGMYNIFNKDSILSPSDTCDLPEGIFTLFESITGGNTTDMEYLMKATLFKYLNPTSCQIPAIILTGAQGTGKTSFVRLMGTMLGAENVQLNVGQRNVEGRFSATGNDKLVYEFAELYTGSKVKDVALANHLKTVVLQEEISSEKKYQDSKFLKNSGWYIITSNNPMPIMLDPSDTSNRRYSVFRGDTPLGDKAGMVYKTITDKKSVAEFVRYLIECYGEEVSKLDVFPAHENEIKALLADNSTNEFVEFWDELRIIEGVGTFVANEDILKKFDIFCEENGYDKKLKMKLMKSCPYTDTRVRTRVGDSQPRGRFITN